MNLWLVGGNGDVNAVILLIWALEEQGSSNRVGGSAEVYVRDRQGMPVLQQRVQIFPVSKHQSLQISRRLLFGRTVFPGRNPDELLDLDLPGLREVAKICMEFMGLVPA
ncbi:hypothetical protein P170DRAFT_434086 [Aspergillus steynii IBT 23096]|uniref:Uncharacterized protein n=1 Tax=Aspergillus steynii IBT 23096 TaxID=1392250 RepID=A0A2I2GHD2_9EURO|nr:uncharacterized protein P170DRAFT_434086 [Aspergillus steynii IBT 23096]PLB52288.1 hypothetical protein P170DRAFT_434086 [Aspergillus steynii IBT 23096]